MLLIMFAVAEAAKSKPELTNETRSLVLFLENIVTVGAVLLGTTKLHELAAILRLTEEITLVRVAAWVNVTDGKDVVS